MFGKLRLRGRILLGYSFPLFLLIVLSGLALGNARRFDVAFKKVQDAKTASQGAAEATLGLSRVERTARGFLIFGSDEILRKTFNAGISDYKRSLASAEKLVVNPSQKERLAKLRQLGLQLEQSSREVVTLVESGRREEAIRIYQTEKSRPYIQGAEALQKEFEQEQNKIIQIAINDVQQATILMQLVAGLGTLISASISIVISYALSSGIAKTIQDASEAVSSSVKEITTTVNEQEHVILEQSASVNETTLIIEEVGTSSLQSAQTAEISAGGAQKALDLAEEGTRTVGVTMEGILELKNQVIAIANQIVRLSEQTAQITTVSDLVADLANQTNMLALNAGVEAARAGEHGKGFAVVAGEIRKLADQSRKSADRIHLLVNEVQAAINSTIMVTDEGTKKATHGIKLAEETGDVFINISDAVNRVFLNNQEIVMTAKQQAVAVQRIVAAMNAINLGAKETTVAISQVKEVTEDLNEAAQNLQAVL
ncbi:methyl-accepting chemotaxis protein [Mastigocladopsis repens]|uniref:methyl-accepting chemotaxis protein n=1 Tax=Mastigocladopsis repens TaxID=221287 RepID=UPI0002F2EC3A|nr:methyl-accepting chemotaxis protein [Mastigocladopsis repens]